MVLLLIGGANLSPARRALIEQSHTAEGDTVLVYEWLKAKHPDILNKYNELGRTVIMDIETSTLGENIGEILQISYVDALSGEVLFTKSRKNVTRIL